MTTLSAAVAGKHAAQVKKAKTNRFNFIKFASTSLSRAATNDSIWPALLRYRQN
jgi:hypothetical protein